MIHSIHWYDWITPSNPFAALVTGILLVAIAAISYYYESKKLKGPLIVFIIGCMIVVAGVYLLDLIGFYG